MPPRKLADYLHSFFDRGREIAYAQSVGYRTERWTYLQVAETACRFARELESRGIGKGDRILLWGPSSAQWAAAFLGAALCGVVVVPIDDIATDDFALRIWAQVNGKLTLVSRTHASTVADLPSVTLDSLVEILQTHSGTIYPAVDVQAADPLEIVFTSGSTAEPKGVVILHGNVLSNLAPLETEIARYLKYERPFHPIRFLNLLPLSHVFGQFLGIFVPQLLGGTVIFQESLKPAEIIHIIRRERVSVLVSVPRVIDSLKEKIENDLNASAQLDQFRSRFGAAAKKHFLARWWIFRHLRRRFGWKFWAFISGGAALDSETEEFWQRLGYAVIQGYGMTETTSLISVNHPFRVGKGSIGKVLPGREILLADDGEIMVRGGGVASSYWSSGAPQPMSGNDGWFRTGDLGETDASGNLYFKGRKKEVIVTAAGMKIYPQDLEATLRLQPEVKDCVVISLPDKQNAEPCAVLVLQDGADPSTVIDRANTTLADYQRIKDCYIWPEPKFPLTSTLKPRRNLIAEAVRLARSGGPAQAQIKKSDLRELIGQLTNSRASTAADLDANLNLSSLDRVALLSALEDRYQTEIDEVSFSQAKTVGDLETLLRSKSSEPAFYHYPSWAQRWPVVWIRIFAQYLLLRPAVFLLAWPQIIGSERLRSVPGPVLVVCNHIDDVDIGFIIAALPARLGNHLAIATRGEALEILRTPVSSRSFPLRIFDQLKWTLGVSLLNLFPLPRESGFRAAFHYAGDSVDRGYSVLVFPEGRHTEDGCLLPFRSGVGILANNLNLPVVPMRIDGLFERKKAGKKYALPGKIKVRIGDPVRFESDADPEEIARELRDRVAEL
jgi:long-chain acyl-CoA synthetase